MGVMDVFKASSIKQENQELTAELESQRQRYAEIRLLLEEIGGHDVELAKAKKVEYENQTAALKRELEQLRLVREDLKKRIANYETEARSH